MRLPRVEVSVTVASSAQSGVIVSLAGLAVIRLPATVPRLRICGAPTSHAACASGSAWATIRSEPTKWLCVTSGPMWILPPSSVMLSRPGTRLMSISASTPGRSLRSSSMMMSVPPATMRARSPRRLSRSSASLIVVTL
ncbi:MAG: hypothetical protein M5R40_09235 [Anaerolineae bacterium]|nr:hypothetical protein [Anaerolineae bacterium]